MDRIRELLTLEEKERHWDLLYLADPDRDMVMKYLARGRMFALYEGGAAVCEAVVAEREDGQVELMNFATDPAHQRKGYGSEMIGHLRGALSGQYQKLYVGTAFFGLYERWGFRYAYTIEHFFVDNYPEPVIDEGRLCVDMVCYEMDL